MLSINLRRYRQATLERRLRDADTELATARKKSRELAAAKVRRCMLNL